jgi:hypothetical protein
MLAGLSCFLGNEGQKMKITLLFSHNFIVALLMLLRCDIKQRKDISLFRFRKR